MLFLICVAGFICYLDGGVLLFFLVIFLLLFQQSCDLLQDKFQVHFTAGGFVVCITS